MRHISFDESSVMKELVKIALDKNIIANVAMGANLTAALRGQKFDTSKLGSEWVHYLNNLAPTTKSLAEYNKLVSDLASKLSSKYNISMDKLMNPSKKFVGDSWPEQDKAGRTVRANSLSQGNKDGNLEMDAVDNMKHRLDRMFNAKGISREERKVLLQDTEKLLKDLQEFESAVESDKAPQYETVNESNKNDIYDLLQKNKYIQDKEKHSAYCPWCEKGNVESGIKTCPECEAKINKKASQDVYDVSGETAEDLVESAHGKKGTETEVSIKPKDDGALVENLIEQNKKDKEVAQKKPTGAYASLIVLQKKLNDMGLTKYADQVSDVIDIIVPKEVVLSYKLNTLAKTLDNKGYTKYAKIVSSLLKKKVIASEEYLSELSSDAAKIFIDCVERTLGDAHYKPVIDVLRNLQNQGWRAVTTEAKRLAEHDPKIQNAIHTAFSDKAVLNAVNIWAAGKKGEMRAQEGLKPTVFPNTPVMASIKTAAELSYQDAKKEFNATSLKLAQELVNYLSENGDRITRPYTARLANITNKGWFMVLSKAQEFANYNENFKNALNTFMALPKTRELVLLLNDYRNNMNNAVHLEVGAPTIEPAGKKVLTPNAKVKEFQVAWNNLVSKPYHKTDMVLVEDGLYGKHTRAAVKDAGGLSVEKVKEYAQHLKELIQEGQPTQNTEAKYKPEQLYNFFIVKEADKIKKWFVNQAISRVNQIGAKTNKKLNADAMSDLNQWASSAWDLVKEQMKNSNETNPTKYRTELMASLDAKIGDDLDSLTQLLA